MYTRNIERPSRTKNIFKFSSLKMNRIITVESSLEFLACFHFEYSPDVLSFKSQPKGFYYKFNNKKLPYTPDFKITRKSNNEATLVEIKPKVKASHPEFIEKFILRIEQSESLGKELILLTEKVLSAEPYISNLKLFHRYAGFHEFNDIDITLLKTINKHRSISIEQAAHKSGVAIGKSTASIIRLLRNNHINADIRNFFINENLIVNSTER